MSKKVKKKVAAPKLWAVKTKEGIEVFTSTQRPTVEASLFNVYGPNHKELHPITDLYEVSSLFNDLKFGEAKEVKVTLE